MGLIHVLTSDGREVLVHSSIFDTHRPPRLLGDWPDVWARLDAAREPPKPPVEP